MRALLLAAWAVCLSLCSSLLAAPALAGETPLELANALETYLDCQDLCTTGYEASKSACLADCGAAKPAWDKNLDEKYDRVDYELALLVVWAAEQQKDYYCEVDGKVVPIGASGEGTCGVAKCVATGKTEDQCADKDEDGLPAWAEDSYGTSDTEKQKSCSECGGFENECRWLVEANRTLCVPRDCARSKDCTAFHLETIAADNDEVIVWVVFDYAPTPPTALDLRLSFTGTSLTLVGTRALSALTERHKGVQVTQSPGKTESEIALRLIVLADGLGRGATLPILPGPLAELVFLRTSSAKAEVAFSDLDSHRTGALAPFDEAQQSQLADDKLWGSSVEVAASVPTGDRLVLHYSFDSRDQPLDVASVPSGEQLCSMVSDCAIEDPKKPAEKLRRDKLVARYGALQEGVVQVSESISGASGQGVFLDGRTDHLELPLSFRPGRQKPVDAAAMPKNLLADQALDTKWVEFGGAKRTPLDGRAPDQASKAISVTDDSALAAGGLKLSTPAAVTPGTPHTFSVFIEKPVGGSSEVQSPELFFVTSKFFVQLDLVNGTARVRASGTGGSATAQARLEDFGPWWRAVVTYSPVASQEMLQIYAARAPAGKYAPRGNSVVGSATISSAQLEVGSAATAYRSKGVEVATDQSFSLSTWFYTDGLMQAEADGTSPHGAILFAHTVQDSERTRFGVAVRDSGDDTHELVWFEGAAGQAGVPSRVIQKGLPAGTWVHLGMSVDAVAGVVRFYVNGAPAPATTNGEGIPVAFASLPTLTCPAFETEELIRLPAQGGNNLGLRPERVLVGAVNGGLFGIDELDANGLSRRDLVRTGEDQALDPDYSAVLDKLVYTSTASGNFEIWVANGDGTKPTQVTQGFGDTERGFYARRPRWAPDGSAIVFESNAYSVAFNDNTWHQVYHLYYVPYDPLLGQVSVSLDGTTSSVLAYEELVALRYGPAKSALDAFRIRNSNGPAQHLYGAEWLVGKQTDGTKSTLGLLVATSAKEDWSDRMVVTLELGATLSEQKFAEVFSRENSDPDAREVEYELLAARRVHPAGQPDTRSFFVSKEWVTDEVETDFTASVNPSTYDATLTYTPKTGAGTRYRTDCWDLDRDELCSAEENKDGQGTCDVADCFPTTADLLIKLDPSLWPKTDSKERLVFEAGGFPEGSGQKKVAQAKALYPAGKTAHPYVRLEVTSPGNQFPLVAGQVLGKIGLKKNDKWTGAVSPTVDLERRASRQELLLRVEQPGEPQGEAVALLTYPQTLQRGFDDAHGGEFGRASALPGGQYVDSTVRGVELVAGGSYEPRLIPVAPNRPRWERTTSTKEPMLLLEGARTNSVAPSGDMAGEGWSYDGTGKTTLRADVAPDGTLSASRVVLGTGQQSDALQLGLGSDGVLSLWTSASAASSVLLKVGDADSRLPLGVPWSRQVVAAKQADLVRFLADASAAEFLAWGFQAESGAQFASSYIPTTGKPVTRAADKLVFRGAALSTGSLPDELVKGSWSIALRPSFPSDAIAVGETPTLASFENGQNAIYVYRKQAGTQYETYLGVSQGGLEKVTAGPLEWSAGDELTFTFHATYGVATDKKGAVGVAGATRGNLLYVGSNWQMPPHELRIGGVSGGASEFFAAYGPPRSIPKPAEAKVDPVNIAFEDTEHHFDRVLSAAFSPDGDRLLLYGLEGARPVLGRTRSFWNTKKEINSDLVDTDDLTILSTRAERVAGLEWTRVERGHACDWMGGVRNPTTMLFDGALRGGLDEVRLHNYVRTPEAFASESARGHEWLPDAPPDSHQEICRRDTDCPAYKLCDRDKGGNEGICVVTSCDPAAAYPCDRGECRAMPLPVGLGAFDDDDPQTPSFEWVCSVECDADSQCARTECLNGPCLYCSPTESCIECRHTEKEFGGIKFDYVEGCPDRNGFSCEAGSCYTECYEFPNGESQYVCDPALEYCRGGRCVAHDWAWADFSPMSFAGLGETHFKRENLRDTIALSQFHELVLEAYGVEDYLDSPEVVVEGKVEKASHALYPSAGDPPWFTLGHITVHNRTAADAASRPYRLMTRHPVTSLRFRLVNPPYQNLNAGATGLMAGDETFCSGRQGCTAPDPERPNGSTHSVGYPVGITELEARQACEERFGDDAKVVCGSVDVKKPAADHLQGGLPAVVIKAVRLDEIDLFNAVKQQSGTMTNLACGYWEPKGADVFTTPPQGDGPYPRGTTAFGRSHLETFLEAKGVLGRPTNTLADFKAETTNNGWGLLNCNYANANGTQVASLVLDGFKGALTAQYRFTITDPDGLDRGGMHENGGGCTVELDDVRFEACYEMIGDDASIDPFNPKGSSRRNQTLTYDLWRSFGHGAAP